MNTQFRFYLDSRKTPSAYAVGSIITGTKQRLKYILSDLNDYRNYNFSQIADYIEATLL